MGFPSRRSRLWVSTLTTPPIAPSWHLPSIPQWLARGFSGLPYAGFPTGLTVAQALRPLPQFNGVVQTWNPLGDTWYDALQAKATKRFSHGLDFVVTYTWSKSLTLGSEENNNYGSTTTPVINDVFNRGVNKTFSGFDQPQSIIISGNYTTPKILAGT